jgi:hypothetical protein
MGRFTGIALALALIAGCAKSKESRMAEPPGSTGGAPTGASPTPVGTPNESPKADPVRPLDPSANDDPNSAKQLARASGGLGATNQFDDKPIEDDLRAKGGDPPKPDTKPKTTESKTGTSRGSGAQLKLGLVPDDDPVAGGTQSPPMQVGLAIYTVDEVVKKATDAQRTALQACKKSASGMLEIAITVDAAGKVTSAKLTASSTLKDKTTSDCVLAIVKKLQLGKDAKVTAPLRITLN